MFLVESLEPQDRHQWLQNSWGFTRVKSDREPVLTAFGSISTSSPVGNIRRYESPTKFRDSTEDLASMQCFCHWPLGGAINIPLADGNVVAGVLSRRTERQYRRSYVPGLMTLEFPRLWDATKKFGRQVSQLNPSSPSVVWGAFFPTYPHAHQALSMLREKRTSSVAIGASLILVGDGKHVLIYDKMKNVGEIVGGQVRMTYDDSYVIRRIQKQITAKLESAP